MLDVNAGIPLADEPGDPGPDDPLVQSLVDVPLSIDSSIVEALEAGLAAYVGKPLVNSVTGEEERLERVLPLIRKYGAAVVAISNDDTGISEDPDVRFEVARRIVERAADHGIPREDVIVDPLVMPIGAMATAGQQVFRLVRRLREELGVNTTCGASNVSFGMPEPGADQRRVPADGDRVGPDVGDHQPARRRGEGRDHGRRRPDGQRPGRGRWIRAHRAAAAAPEARARRCAAGGPRPSPPPTRGAGGGRPRINRRAPRRARRADAHAGRRHRGMSAGAESRCAQVIFTPSGRRGRFGPGRRPRCGARSSASTSIRCAAAVGCAVDARSSRRRARSRSTASSRATRHLSPRGADEDEFDRLRGLAAGPPARLPCAHIHGDVLVDVPPESQVHRQVVRKGVPVRDFVIDPVVRLHEVEIERPDLATAGRRPRAPARGAGAGVGPARISRPTSR